jgi:hypothetical protein
MRIPLMVRCLVVVAVLALALPAAPKPVSKSIDLLVPAKVGRTNLDVGQYKVHIDGNKVTVEKAGRTLVETTGEFAERPIKQRNNSVLVGSNGELLEIRFAGDKRVLILNN